MAKPAATTAVQAAASNGPEIALDSPDHAVKTWWRIMDMTEEYRTNVCKRVAEERAKSPDKYLISVAYGPALESLQRDRTCTPTKYDRDIQEVKTESETRAVVFATVKNATPIPQGAVLSDFQVKARSKGERVKYTLEKTEQGWKVAQVAMYRDYNRDWENAYETTWTPAYPSYVMPGSQ